MVKMLDNPCDKCGWRMPGFHICVLDYSTPEGVKRATFVESTELGAPSLLNNPEPKKRAKKRTQPVFGSEQDRANRSESVRQARAREQGRAERDAEIIRLYDVQHFSMNGTAAALGIDYRTVSKVLKEAAAAGEIVLQTNLGGRPRQDDSAA